MDPLSFTEVLERFYNGEAAEEQAFDMRLFQAVEKVKAKYDIRFDASNPVPDDGDLADRCFAAGREVYAELGTWCADTKRVAHFSGEVIDAAMEASPSEVPWGAGEDEFARDPRPPRRGPRTTGRPGGSARPDSSRPRAASAPRRRA